MRRSARLRKHKPNDQSDIVDSRRVRDRLMQLNKNVLLPVTNQLRRDPAADITHVLTRTVKNYPKQRDWHTKVTSDVSLSEKYAGKARDRKLREETYELPSPRGDLVITRPLADQVVRLLELSDGSLGVAGTISSKRHSMKHDTPSTKLLRTIEEGSLIWHLCGKFVVRLDENTVVKFASAMNVNDAVTMEHIKIHAPDMLIPLPLGVASIDTFNYVFMSFVEGVSLDKLWPSLTIPLKRSVQAQLCTILSQLRALPLPSGSALGSGEPRRCKDMRRIPRICPDKIETEQAFNKFLTESTDAERHFCPLWMQMIRSRLRNDHNMVMTHGDLRDANIMAEYKKPDGIQVTGLVDWGSGGIYPEYWEYVKACSGLRARSKNDWFEFLPILAIGRYVEEYMIDIMIDQIHT